MIIQEKETEWEIVRQHDHAFLSWQLAVNWHPDYFPYPNWKQEVVLAVKEHDRAWIPLDKEGRWNKEKERPHDFITFPLPEKLAAYERGINELESLSSYAALLSSLHYTSFFQKGEDVPAIIKEFLLREEQRRKKLYDILNLPASGKEVEEHLILLQFCDDFSLYICLNPPGVSKKNEFSWFRNGFRQKFPFAPKGMEAEWDGDSRIIISPFPLKGETEIEMLFYKVEKKRNKQQFTREWREASPVKRKITLKSPLSR